MLNAARLRISLAVVTIAGAFHLDRAQAAEPGRVQSCEAYALWYADNYCTTLGGNWSSVTYTCNPDGTTRIHSVSCRLEEAN